MKLQKAFDAVTDKVIFLDFDGPLSSCRTYAWVDGNLAFDPVAVGILQNICEATGGRIVCTSTRTFTRGDLYNAIYHETKTHFERAGFDWSYMHPDWTVNKPDFVDRKGNIKAYLELHPEIKKWAIVDDDFVDMPELVRVDAMDGILYGNFQEICDYLDVSMSHVHRLDFYKKNDVRQYSLPFNKYEEDWNNKHVRKDNTP